MNLAPQTRNIIIAIISACFILLFIYAALSKLIDYQKFLVELKKSPLLVDIAIPVGVGIPLIEIILAVMLITDRFRLAALYGSFGLMVVFTAYLVAILNFSDYVPCTCGGVLEKMTWRTHIMFNVSFVFLAMIAILLYNRQTFVLQYNRESRKPG